MPASTSAHPPLDALLGDTTRALPDEILAALEALRQPPPVSAPPAFFAALDTIRHGDCANGQRWTEARQSFISACDMAAVSRTLRGLSVVLDLLHAAERSRHGADEDEQFSGFVVDGLMAAARELTTHAQASLGPQ